MPITEASAPQIHRAAPATVSDAFAKDTIIAWYRGEFAAANAIIDALCSHLRQVSEGEAAAAVTVGEYEATFVAIHRRRLNWIPVLQMQKYHSIAEVAIELNKVAARKAEGTKEKTEEVAKACLACEKMKSSGKVAEIQENGAVGETEEESPDSDITDTGSQEVQQRQETFQICENHEECNARSAEITPIKGFQAKEQVKGHTVNVVKGLKLYEGIFSEQELCKLTDFVNELRAAGQNGELSGETFILFNKQIKGNKRELIQLGVPIFGHIKDEPTIGNLTADIEPIPALLQSVIDHLVTWKLIPEYKKPNGCVVNFFEEDEYSQPFLKPPHLEQPISTLILSESTMAFGRTLASDNDRNFRGPLMLPLKQGSLLVMRGNSAEMARHVMCPSANKRVSITLFRVRPEASHQGQSPPTTPQASGGVMTLWQPPTHPLPTNPFLNSMGLLHAPVATLAAPPVTPMVLTSPKRLTGGGTGVFLPWTGESRKHVRRLPPRAQKRRFLSLMASPGDESANEPGISVGGV